MSGGSSGSGQALASQRFARVGIFMFVANTGAGVMVYALQILMARMLSVSDYGLFAALIGIFNMTAIPLTAAVLTVTRAVSRSIGRADVAEVGWIIRRSATELAVGLVPLLIAAVAVSGLITDLLHAPSVVPVILLWAAVSANAASVLGLAVLQGAQRFGRYGTITLANAGLRLAVTSSAVAIGLGAAGALGGFAGATLAGAVAVWWAGRSLLRVPPGETFPQPLFVSRATGLLIASNVAFVAMTQFDYVLARVFLPPEQASSYAAASVLAKSVLWLPVGIVIALFPMVASEVAARRSSAHLLRQALVMAAATSGALAGVLAIGAGWWVHLLYGGRFEAAAPYLAWLSLAYLPLAIVLVVDNHQLAMHRARFILAYAVVAAAEVIALALPGATAERLVTVIVVGSVACLAWAAWIVLRELRVRGESAGTVSRS